MIHPATELMFINDAVGCGVVARELIPCGTITWVHDVLDIRFPAKHEWSQLPSLMHSILDKYSFRDIRSDEYIMCWDNARFMNHSCEPTCGGTHWGVEIALRDIHVGEELTVDYTTLGMTDEDIFFCACGSPSCPKEILPCPISPDKRYFAQMAAALETMQKNKMPQPLFELISPEKLSLVCAYFLGESINHN